MVFRKAPPPQQPRQGASSHEEEEILAVVERSSDPIELLSNILTLAGNMSAQWGEEIILHLRVATLWARIGKKSQAIEYIIQLAQLHAVDAFNLGYQGVRLRIDMMRYLLIQLGVDETTLNHDALSDKSKKSQLRDWIKNSKLAKLIPMADSTSSGLTEDEQMLIREIVHPNTTWLERVYLTQIPGDTRRDLVQELNSINEYGNPDEVAKKLYTLFDHCRRWHERQSDTPIWVHELDDIGPRAMYLAVSIERPEIIATYLNRCIDALQERPLALMPNIATAIGGLAYVAKRHRRDDLLHRALEALPRLPEHERCISALTLVEVLIERAK
ncbi:MAG: hypothetical protein ACYC7E_00370 [Armatimonadota bacterium]